MQDGVTPHTAKENVWALHSVFGEINRIKLLARVCGPLDPQI
jgi:hypothetical protein